MSSNKVKLKSTEEKCQKGYRQLQCENRIYQEVNFESMVEQLQADYLDRYEGLQEQMHKMSQSHDSSAVSSTYLCKHERLKKMP